MSDFTFDDDIDNFFNVAQDDMDYKYDRSTVITQSKTQLEDEKSSKSNKLSSVDHASSLNTGLHTSDDSNNTKEEEEEIRGRSKTRDSYISLSSSSSRESSISRNGSIIRSRSSSFEIEFEMKRRKMMKQTNNDCVDDDDDDENDDFFKELEQMNNSSIKNNSDKEKDDSRSNTIDLDLEPTNNNNNNDNNNNNSESCNTSINETKFSSNPKRIYKIQFLSKLEGTINKSVHIKVLGKYTFENILPSVTMGLIKAFKVPKSLQRFYEPDNIVLYRNESMKLLKFMNCNSLNIPQSFENEISDVQIVLVSKDKELEYENMVNQKIFGDDENELITDQANVNLNQNDIDSQLEKQFEEELKDNNNSTNNKNEYSSINNDVTKREEPLIKVALLGEDNKKVYVNVRNSTLFKKLVDYYRIQKQVPHNKKIILSFDHEEIDLNECIQDQDIEDEDVIDVIVK